MQQEELTQSRRGAEMHIASISFRGFAPLREIISAYGESAAALRLAGGVGLGRASEPQEPLPGEGQ